MSEENVDAVRRLITAVQAADLEAATTMLAQEIEIEDTDIPDAEHSWGHDGFVKWVARWSESWESWRVEDIEVLPAGEEHAVGLFRMVATGRGSGIEIARGDAIVCRVRCRKIVALTYYNDQQRALGAVGLTG